MRRLAASAAAAATVTAARALRLSLVTRSRSRQCFSARPEAPWLQRRKVSTKSSLEGGGPVPPLVPSLPPPSRSRAPVGPAVELSDREMLRRLLRRPQRQWYWLGGVVLVGTTLVAFGPELKVGVSKHTADVATKSLQDETLQSHTRELASQIVQTVLNDPKVLDQASFFIQRLVVMDVTRDALRSIVVHTLNDPTTLANVTKLAKTMLTLLLDDPNTRAMVVAFLKQTMQDPQTREGLLKLLDEIMKDKTMQKNLAQLLAQTFGTEPVKTSVSTTIGESVHDVLSRPDIQNHAKQFVGSVVQDQTVQAQSGDAIWGTVMYAITPGWLSWIWASDEDKATVEAAAAVAGVSATAHAAEAEAVVGEAGEAFVDAVERRVEAHEANTAVERLGDSTSADFEDIEAEEVSPSPSPPSKFEMLRRFTMRLPLLSSYSAEKEREEEEKRAAAAAREEEEERQRQLKGKGDAESYADRHWSGSGSGFL